MTQTTIAIDRESAEEIEEIPRRRANEIARFHSDYTSNKEHLGSVELALSREIDRLRDLAEKLTPNTDSGDKSDV